MAEPRETIYGEGYCKKHDVRYRAIQGTLGGCYLCNAEKFQDKLLKVGREVSRKEALKVSREILERAEKERKPPESTDEETRRVLAEKVMG